MFEYLIALGVWMIWLCLPRMMWWDELLVVLRQLAEKKE